MRLSAPSSVLPFRDLGHWDWEGAVVGVEGAGRDKKKRLLGAGFFWNGIIGFLWVISQNKGAQFPKVRIVTTLCNPHIVFEVETGFQVVTLIVVMEPTISSKSFTIAHSCDSPEVITNTRGKEKYDQIQMMKSPQKGYQWRIPNLTERFYQSRILKAEMFVCRKNKSGISVTFIIMVWHVSKYS